MLESSKPLPAVGRSHIRIIAAAFTVILLGSQVHAAEPAGRIGPAWEDARNPIVKTFGGERLGLWSLRPVGRAPLPALNRTDWPRQPLDVYLLARHESDGHFPREEADPRTLIRRLSFGLHGLPPTPGEVREFAADDRPDAYERLVDRLLVSPRYGEHAARMWLDVVRYSDSNGFDWDELRKDAWRYRDYVIRSFNQDKPLAQFIVEQLAGDELLAGPPRTPAEQELLLATGYLRMGPQDNAATLFNEQSRARHELLVDLTETTGSAFLGLTLACCRCHDHKYDPLSQADHYRLRAFFEPVKYGDQLPLNLADELATIEKHNQAVDRQTETLQKKQTELLTKTKERLKSSGSVDPSDADAIKAFDESEKQRHEEFVREIKNLQETKRSTTHGLLMTDAEGEVPATHLLNAGDHKSPKEPVEPGFVSVLDPNPVAFAAPTNPNTKGRRLTLARWIASPDNPLTYRVFANRLWQLHFGEGLVATPNDFGLAGEKPTSPEMLDWLALEVGANAEAGNEFNPGHTVKRLHRLLVTSATYRQLRPADMPLRRLSAEQLRDSLLAVSGLLNSKAAGPPAWPELPPEVLQANPAFLDDNAEKVKGWYPSPAHEQHARSVFMIQKRTVRVPFMETFDLPENSVSCGRRNLSIVAPQALSLLNSPLAIQAAKSFAERVEQTAGGERNDQIVEAFWLSLQRPPTANELKSCEGFLATRSLSELCRVLFNLNEFLYLD